MSRPPQSVIWPADPHTIAKIEIVKRYLYRWAIITGCSFAGKPLTYIDGFAGPGEYNNHPEGSPTAALRALNDAKRDAGSRWRATEIRVLFVEQDWKRIEHLKKLVKGSDAAGDVKWFALNAPFVEGLAVAESAYAKAFFTSAPLVVFIDPFGATGFPWSAVEMILRSKTSEIILNFDADGMARIAKAGKDANADEVLTTIFGGTEWISAVQAANSMRDMEMALLGLYKKKLRSLPNVKYTFAFEMASSANSIDYFLLFASQHHLGLEKMKEAMRELDKSGAFRFSDAEAGQGWLFDNDSPDNWIPKLMSAFGGASTPYEAVLEFTLNETPYVNPSRLLYAAQEKGFLTVDCDPPRKKKNSFKQDEIKMIHFIGGVNGKADVD